MDSILFVSRICPGARAIGSDTRTVRVLRWLAESGRRVHFVRVSRKILPQRPAAAMRRLMASYRSLHVAGNELPRIATISSRRLTRPHSLGIKRLWARLLYRHDMATQLTELVEQTQANVLWFDHAAISPLAANLPRREGVLRVIDTHDVLHLRDASLRDRGLPVEYEVSRDEERHLMSAFDVIVAIQDQERKVLERMLPQRTVVTVGHAVDLAPQPCSSQDVCFVGSQSAVNAASLLAFVEHAWPKIREAEPGARLQIVGGVGNCDGVLQAAQRDARIVLRGVVTQMSGIYAGPAVMICPLWVGSGLKIKMVEALAHGKAVVATPVAAQGLEDGIDSAFDLAHRPEDFAEPVIDLLQSAARRVQLERRAIDYARDKFSASRIWRPMDEILQTGLQPPALAFAA